MASGNTLADAGMRYIKKRKYAEGIVKLTEALKERPAPMWYIERSKGYLRMNHFDLALYDAEMALRIAFDRANRPQMADAQIRRAVALFRMGKFADADLCAFWALRLVDGAKALEDDGQQSKVDDNGDYAARLAEVQDELKPEPNAARSLAFGTEPIRTKEFALRSEAFTWRIQALGQMEKLPAGHDGRKIHALVKYPETSQIVEPGELPAATLQEYSAAAATADAPIVEAPEPEPSLDTWEDLHAQYARLQRSHQTRIDWYQSRANVTITIFVRHMKKEEVTVESHPQYIKLHATGDKKFSALGDTITIIPWERIQPEHTQVNFSRAKIEVLVVKETVGNWPTLRLNHAFVVDNLTFDLIKHPVPFKEFLSLIDILGLNDPKELELPDLKPDPAAWYRTLIDKLQSRLIALDGAESVDKSTEKAPDSKAVLGPQPPSRVIESIPTHSKPKGAPAYPTSSKKGPTNWDKIDEDAEEEAQKNADVNSFFQQIYEGADEDTKRAMMKSFVESNGTALSTSWNDAKDKTYQTQPPDGVEAKKWE
ncbi:SGS domain-containing protein [Nemania sp. NC0429]|nr:SGS domain-containing protein [Nemania sp. NC0429]